MAKFPKKFVAKGAYEGSPADMREDAKQARKAKMSPKQWEKSAADKRLDKKGR